MKLKARVSDGRPMMYLMAEEGNLPFNTTLFALIAKKIADRGVGNYCG